MSEKITGYSRGKGAMLMILSAFSFAAMQIAIKKTGGVIPLMEQVFFRNIVVLILCVIIIKRTGGPYLGTRKQQPLLFLRSIFGFLGLIAMFYASRHGIQADITILMKLSPFLITLWAAIFLKEKIAKIQIPALILAFSGAAIIANPVFQTNMMPLFMALLCAFFSSVAYTLLAYFRNKVDGMVIVLHFSMVCCVGTIPFMIGNFVVPDMDTLLLLLLIGVFGGLGQIALTYSYRYAPAGEVSIYNYSGIIFSMFLGFAFLAEPFTPRAIIGGGAVILASILTYKFSDKTK